MSQYSTKVYYIVQYKVKEYGDDEWLLEYERTFRSLNRAKAYIKILKKTNLNVCIKLYETTTTKVRLKWR